MADSGSVSDQVRSTFEAVREGDASGVGRLVRHGEALIPSIVPLLDDRNAKVRLEAVSLLDALDSKEAAQAAIAALDDEDSDIRTRAARLVFRAVMLHGPGEFPGLESALATSEGGSPSPDAARLLLLAFAPGGEPVLESALDDDRLVKLSDDRPAVEAALAAEVALSRRGSGEARSRLLDRISAGETADLVFLLEAIAMIDAPEILHALAERTLSNEQEIGGAVPAGVSPGRRITDLAVEAFISRLDLRTGIETSAVKRYGPEEIEQVRSAIAGSIPR